jgi:hypothetical protein
MSVPHRAVALIIVLLMLATMPVRASTSTIRATGEPTWDWWQHLPIAPATLQAGRAEALNMEAGRITLADGAISGRYRSPAIAAPLAFNAANLRWREQLGPSARLRVQLRTSVDGQRWGDWQDGIDDEIARDSSGLRAGRQIAVPDAERLHRFVQFQLVLERAELDATATISDLALFVSDSTRGVTTEQALARQHEIDRAQVSGPMQTARPPVISRTAWGSPDGPASPQWPPEYATVKHIIIHHTVNQNTSSDWASVVRSIWVYHAQSLGWGDIGYHYLIDPDGVIYEGRAGGDDVVAGHTRDFNTGTLGIAWLGCFDPGACADVGGGAAPTAAAMEAATALLRWKAQQRDLDLQGSATDDRGRIYQVLSGHRDHMATNCPGQWLYERLPELRQIDTVPPGGQIETPARDSIIIASPVGVSASAWDNDGGSGVDRVEFYVFYDAEWHFIDGAAAEPYSAIWTPPAELQAQQLHFTIHVYDRAGNQALDPGGYRDVVYSPNALSFHTYLPMIQR